MLKEEFEKLVKKEVTEEEYAAWESAYMTSDADKAEFCRKVAQLVKGKPEEKKYAYLDSIHSPFFPQVLRGEYKINIGTGKVEIYNGEIIERPTMIEGLKVFPEQIEIKTML